MTNFLPVEIVQRILPIILSPLYRLIDDDTIKEPRMGNRRLNDFSVSRADLLFCFQTS